MRRPGSAAELERRRRLAIERLKEGYRPSEVSRFLGVNDSSVRRWVRVYRLSGPKGLKSQAPQGRPRKLTYTQEKIVLRWIRTDTALDHGFPTELWTGKRVAQLIRQEFGVHFNPDYLTTWLRARGCTPQMPSRIPRQRDPKKIARWLKMDWPRIKKKRS
jgi:transposase